MSILQISVPVEIETEILQAPSPTDDLSRISRTNLRLYLINPVGPSVQTLP